MNVAIQDIFGTAVNQVQTATTSMKDMAVRQLLRSRPLWLLATAPAAMKRGVSIAQANDNAPIEISKDDRVVRLAARHRQYLWDVLNAFEAYFGPVEPEHIAGRWVVDYSVAREHVLRPSGERYFFTSLAESDATAELYAEMGRLCEGAVVIDGGAYCGASAVSMARVVGAAGRVIAFEPDVENYAALVRNVAAHGAKNVITSARGLWSSSGSVDFQSDGNMGSSILEASGRIATRVSRVEVTSLADVVREYRLERLDFVKLDIEGSEVPVVEAAAEVFAKFRPRVIVEAHLVGGELTTAPLCRIFEDYGYKTHLLLEFPGATYQLVLGVPS